MRYIRLENASDIVSFVILVLYLIYFIYYIYIFLRYSFKTKQYAKLLWNIPFILLPLYTLYKLFAFFIGNFTYADSYFSSYIQKIQEDPITALFLLGLVLFSLLLPPCVRRTRLK